MRKFAVVKRLKDNKYCPYRLTDVNAAEIMICSIIKIDGGTREEYNIEFVTEKEYELLDFADDLY